MPRTVVNRPLVSVVTPVHNGEAYLAECIESVLAQTYDRWEYTIVNNCSRDRSLEVAEHYAGKDPRIRVVSTETLLNVMASQNYAFQQVSDAASYCKMVHADDWLFPDCLRRMVDLAEAYPSVGLVGAYRLDAHPEAARVGSDGLPYPSPVVPGLELCRRSLAGRFSIGPASAVLIRAEHVRRNAEVMPESEVFGDLAAWYDILQKSDFGFVHQVLTFNRHHRASLTSHLAKIDADRAADLSILTKYGPLFFTPEEFNGRLRGLLNKYHLFLAASFMERREPEFWRYHRDALRRLGYSLTRKQLLRAVFSMWWYPAAHPLNTLRYAGSFGRGLARRLPRMR